MSRSGALITQVYFCLAALTAGAVAGPAAAIAADNASGDELTSLSLEELMEVRVTSVSKRPEKLLEAPAAVQVITGDDISRAGATEIADALKLAGNLDVARKDSHEWVISARGFSSDVGNKLLVLMDGRTLYTPLFSGVFWDRQSYILEDIQRIEAISGPGGTLWGSNAVNGVINITTKSAKDTQGLYVEAGGGFNPQGLTSARYGGEISPDVFFRVYGKYVDHRNEVFANGASARDDWQMAQGGFRVDVHPASEDSFTVQGDLYHNNEGISTGGRSKVTGGNVLGRWTHTFSDRQDLSLQVYYDRTHLILPTAPQIFAPAGTFKDDLATYDIDFQHRFRLGDSHRIVWGLGFRLTHDVVHNSPGLGFFPTTLDQNLYSGFAQDEISLRDNLIFTLGTKVEHTAYTGFEVEPSARLQWSLTEQQSLWAAVSRAVRTPSRIDRDISEPTPGYLIVILQGGSKFKSEDLLAYEVGYRVQANRQFGGSLSAFYNDYNNVRSTSMSPLDPVFHLPFPFFFENNLEGHTYGFELSANYQVRDWWMLRGSYRLLKEDMRVKPGKFDFNKALNETADPENQFSLRSAMDLGHDLQVDTTLSWVGRRIINNSGVPARIAPYAEMDMRLGWDPEGPLEFAIVGHNLLHERHAEYGVPGPSQVLIRRAVYAEAIWRMNKR